MNISRYLDSIVQAHPLGKSILPLHCFYKRYFAVKLPASTRQWPVVKAYCRFYAGYS